MTTLDLSQRLPALLAGRPRRSLASSPYRPSAVLVPFVAGAEGWSVLLTQRATDLAHGGQIAFPGGAIDPQDQDAVQAALRETEEELGLSPTAVQVWGLFDDFGPTSSGFYTTPVVAQAPAGYPFRPNPAEVSAIVTVPLAWLRCLANQYIEVRHRPPLPPLIYIWQYGPHKIWGLTSRILKSLLDLLPTA